MTKKAGIRVDYADLKKLANELPKTTVYPSTAHGRVNAIEDLVKQLNKVPGVWELKNHTTNKKQTYNGIAGNSIPSGGFWKISGSNQYYIHPVLKNGDTSFNGKIPYSVITLDADTKYAIINAPIAAWIAR